MFLVRFHPGSTDFAEMVKKKDMVADRSLGEKDGLLLGECFDHAGGGVFGRTKGFKKLVHRLVTELV